MIAAWAELVLLLACLQVLAWSRALPHSGFEFVLCGFVGFLPAVIIGGIEYLGYPSLHAWHRVASDIGAAFGLPVVLLGLASVVQTSVALRRALWLLLAILPLGPLIGAFRLPGQCLLLISVAALGWRAWAHGGGRFQAWLGCVALLVVAMMLLRLRSAHGDPFEALFHLGLAGFLLVAGWLSRDLASATRSPA